MALSPDYTNFYQPTLGDHWIIHPTYSTVQPFSYRDTLNMMTWLQMLSNNVDTLRETVNNNLIDVDELRDSVNDALDDMAKQNTNALAALQAYLERLIRDVEQSGSAWSPVRGRTQSLQTILDDMYDNVRVCAIMAADFDAMEGMTCAAYDRLGLTARGYDLHATDVHSADIGDITSISQLV